jgi:hypothetical protein
MPDRGFEVAFFIAVAVEGAFEMEVGGAEGVGGPRGGIACGVEGARWRIVRGGRLNKGLVAGAV